MAAAVLVVAAVALAASVALLGHEQRKAEAAQLRDQSFVDTAKQTVVNMFSYTQDTIDESVKRVLLKKLSLGTWDIEAAIAAQTTQAP